MRAFDRDLIRGGHYGQRSCEPHLKAEHTGAPTNAANVKKVLANSEPSTHGGKADNKCSMASFSAYDPKRTSAHIYSTMFALSTIDEGMVSPSAFAVFELTVNSNSVGS